MRLSAWVKGGGKKQEACPWSMQTIHSGWGEGWGGVGGVGGRGKDLLETHPPLSPTLLQPLPLSLMPRFPTWGAERS